MSSEIIKGVGSTAIDTQTNTHEVTASVRFVRKQGRRDEEKVEVEAWLASFEGPEEIATEHAGYIIKLTKCQLIRRHLNGALPGMGPAKKSAARV